MFEVVKQVMPLKGGFLGDMSPFGNGQARVRKTLILFLCIKMQDNRSCKKARFDVCYRFCGIEQRSDVSDWPCS